MMPLRSLLGPIIGFGVGVLVSLLVARGLDARRDAELDQLRGRIARDSSVRVVATARTDSMIAHADAAVKQTARAATGWTVARRAAERVPSMLTPPRVDTVVVRELVATIDTLRVAGDSLERAAAADTVTIAALRTSFLAERNAWTVERQDLAHALTVSESRHRHWGFGCSVGPSVVRDPAGVIRVGPVGATCGITYRR